MPEQQPLDLSHLPTLPLVLGVTGHCDLVPTDEEALRTAVRDALKQIEEHCSQTAKIEVLSSLAEGADQLVAEEALKAECRVRAPLPLPPEVYRASTSFKSDESRQNLDNLLKDNRVSWFVVPLPQEQEPKDVDGWRRLSQDPDGRRKCYANAGGYVVRHCLALFALWDGQRSTPDRPSGTGEMVDLKLTGNLPRLYPWRDPLLAVTDTGPVLAIHTPRATKPSSGTAGALRVLVSPTGDEATVEVRRQRLHNVRWLWWRVLGALGLARQHAAKPANAARVTYLQFLETVRSIDEFNRDLQAERGRLAGRLEKATTSLLKKPDWLALVNDKPEFSRLAQVRAAAAGMANRLEDNLKWWHRGLFLVIFFALVFLHLYAHHFEIENGHTVHRPVWLALFLVSMFATVLIVGWIWYRRVDVRRLDYRALAEAIRVRYFWGLAGIKRSVADSYLSQLRLEMLWTERALQSVAPPAAFWRTRFEHRPGPEQTQCLQCVCERWVSEQKQYFHDKHTERHTWAVRYRRIGLVLALVGWVLAASILLRGWHPEDAPPGGALPAPSHPPGQAAANDPSQPAVLAVGLVGNGSSGVLATVAALEVRLLPDAGPGAPTRPADAARHAAEEVTHATHPASGVWHPAHLEIILFSLLVIGGGLLIGYRERQAHEALARQYDNMHRVFERAEHELQQHLKDGDLNAARKLIEALGREALVEHAHWLIVRRIRPFELVIGG